MSEDETASPRLMPEDLVPLFMDDGEFFPDLWWWSFDTFFVRLVRAAAKKLREDGHGYPCSHRQPGADCGCEQEWAAYLEGIERDLAGYEEAKFETHDKEVCQRVQAALHRFVDRMGSWWD